MCGIAGAIVHAPIETETIERCLAAMRHRGPDGAGTQRFQLSSGHYLELLHTRLKVIDLDDRANQPFRAGPLTMVFNGELYNYLELQKELQADGHEFTTASDTEVLVRAIGARGWSALDDFEGMWALAVHDERDGSLTLSRDRFGEKPLYVWSTGGSFYFGSEVKFLAALAGRWPHVNLDQILRYLVNGYKALYKNGQTFFEEVAEVPPGTLLRIDADGRRDERRYWQLRCCPRDAMSYDEAVEGVRARLIRSVGLRLRADVPLAFCMSGGVDSNALIGIAKHVFDYDVHGFTIVNTDPRYDENELVAEAVREMQIRHTAVPVETFGTLPKLRALVRQHDAPIATISYLAHSLLTEAVSAHGYRIAVSGTGADELLTGYYDHHLAFLYDAREEPEVQQSARDAWLEHIRPIVRNPYLQNADRFIRDPDFRAHIFLGADAFAEYLTRPWSEPFAEQSFTSSLLRNRMLNELFHEVVPVILHEDDLNAMSFSIENRSPFLDRQLAEFCFRIPTRHLVRDGYAKRVLRDAVRGLAPARILQNRRKVGFNAPVRSFLDLAASEVRSCLLDDSPVFEYVRRDRIEQLMAREDLPNSRSKFLFNFVNAKLFLEEGRS